MVKYIKLLTIIIHSGLDKGIPWARIYFRL